MRSCHQGVSAHCPRARVCDPQRVASKTNAGTSFDTPLQPTRCGSQSRAPAETGDVRGLWQEAPLPSRCIRSCWRLIERRPFGRAATDPAPDTQLARVAGRCRKRPCDRGRSEGGAESGQRDSRPAAGQTCGFKNSHHPTKPGPDYSLSQKGFSPWSGQTNGNASPHDETTAANLLVGGGGKVNGRSLRHARRGQCASSASR